MNAVDYYCTRYRFLNYFVGPSGFMLLGRAFVFDVGMQEASWIDFAQIGRAHV